MSWLSAGALTGQGSSSSRKILDTCGTPQYGQCGVCRARVLPSAKMMLLAAVPAGFFARVRANIIGSACLAIPQPRLLYPHRLLLRPSAQQTQAVSVRGWPSAAKHVQLQGQHRGRICKLDTFAFLPAGWLVLNCAGLVLSMYDQCGGENNCPSGVYCSDSQW